MPQGLKSIIDTMINSHALIDGVKLREMKSYKRTHENITHIVQTYELYALITVQSLSHLKEP